MFFEQPHIAPSAFELNGERHHENTIRPKLVSHPASPPPVDRISSDPIRAMACTLGMPSIRESAAKVRIGEPG
jgi:hypothetical protein